LWRENPVVVQALGLCPTLAVTNTAENALAMGLATAGVLLASSIVISSIRRHIPHQVRIATYILVIATFVTAVDYLIAAVDLALHSALGAFLSLIVVNCLILGRMEAFAAKHDVRLAMADALGMGAGFTATLLVLGATRELLGSGTLFSLPIFGAGYAPWTIMLLPGGGFFTLAAAVLVARWLGQRRQSIETPA
jgi:electron transport complex protein RnfE